MKIVKGNKYISSHSGMIIKADKDGPQLLNGGNGSKIFSGNVINPGKYDYEIGYHSPSFTFENFQLYEEEPVSTDNYEIY